MTREAKCPLTNMVCPRNSDPARGKYCPAWWEWVETNPITAEERLRKDCGWRAMPTFLTEVIKASNRPAAAIESTRNEIAGGFGRLHQALMLPNPDLPDGSQ